MRSIDNEFYHTPSWRKCRETYLESVNHLCERCLQKGLYVSARVVHHKIHLTEDNISNPDIVLNFDNLEALCQDCHNKEHFKTSKKRYTVGEAGEIYTRGE